MIASGSGSLPAADTHPVQGEGRAIPVASGPICAVVSAPGSKSITNRALLVAALAEGDSVLTGALFSDDTRYMSRALMLAGVSVEPVPDRQEFGVRGLGGGPGPVHENLFVGNAGTAMRFLTSYFTLGKGDYRLDGTERMRQRPIKDLLDALNKLGASVESESGSGCPPVIIHAHGLDGGPTSMPGRRSSQYFSSILLSAPYARRPVEVEVEGPLTSAPYLDLTADVMAAFGAPMENRGYRLFRVEPGQYRGRSFAIEPDASAASYLLAAAAVTGGVVTVRNLSTRSHQGDVAFARILERMGCGLEDTDEGLRLTGADRLSGIDVDMNACSDTALTLAAIAPFCDSPVHIRNVAHMRIQETDRIHAMVTELKRAGVPVEEREDGFSVSPAVPRPATFDTYDDHRIAMSLALIGLRTEGCSIRGPECVNKTFPGFFEVLEGMVGGQGEG